MEYSIEYGVLGARKHALRKKRTGRIKILPMAVLLIVIAFCVLFPSIRSEIQSALIPGDREVTAQAAQTFVENVRSGSGFAEAVGAFCQEVISHGT